MRPGNANPPQSPFSKGGAKRFVLGRGDIATDSFAERKVKSRFLHLNERHERMEVENHEGDPDGNA